MIRVSKVVSEFLSSDEVALEALNNGVLNMTAYARQIRPKIEKRLYRPVQLGTVVTALSRMLVAAKSFPKLKPEVKIEDLAIKFPLTELTFERTAKNIKGAAGLPEKYGQGFLVITFGIGEISIIFPNEIRTEIARFFNDKPKGQYENLAAVTVRFREDDYVEVPNMIYALVATIASRRINLIEIVSTFTEISFVVRQKDVRETVDVLKDHFLT